jgi:outer membrane protein assembly factor BamA
MKTTALLPLLLGASLLRADWIPDSPLVRLGSELDLYFTAKARAEYTDNLFYRAASSTLPDEALSIELTPGLEFRYGTELPLSATLTLARTYVDYVDSELNALDDELDAIALAANYDGGGPLRVSLGASYTETARNNAEFQALIGDVPFLVRQSSAGQNLSLTYGFTEKLSATVGYRNSAIRYYDQPSVGNLTNSKGYGIPFDIRFKNTEKLVTGLSFDYGSTDIHDPVTDAYRWSYERLFYGINLSYQPTDKLQAELKAGLQSTEYDFGGKNDSPSYTLSLTHSITEKLDQSLSVGQEATTSPTGSVNDALRVSYGLNFANSQAWRSSFRVSYSDSSIEQLDDPLNPFAVVSDRNVRTVGASLGLNYNPDNHWSYGLNYSFSRTLDPSSYNVNQVSLEASLRW